MTSIFTRLRELPRTERDEYGRRLLKFVREFDSLHIDCASANPPGPLCDQRDCEFCALKRKADGLLQVMERL